MRLSMSRQSRRGRIARKHKENMASTTILTETDKTPQPGAKLHPLRAKAPEELLPWLTCTLALDVPVLGFTVASLLKLNPGSLVRTSYNQSSDIPLQVNGVAMAWT